MTSGFKDNLQRSASTHKVAPRDDAWKRLDSKLRKSAQRDRRNMNRQLIFSVILIVVVLAIAILMLYFARIKSSAASGYYEQSEQFSPKQMGRNQCIKTIKSNVF